MALNLSLGRKHWMAVAVLAGSVACRANRPADETSIPEQPRDADVSDLRARSAARGSTWKEAGEAPLPVASPSSSAQRTHVVKKGDTIYTLARLYFNGDIHKWHAIYEANRDRVADPNTLKVGQVLVIPD